jgi:hypothetical protein
MELYRYMLLKNIESKISITDLINKILKESIVKIKEYI